MIKRKYINEEIKMLVLSQNEFHLFNKDFDTKIFIDKLIEIIDDQKKYQLIYLHLTSSLGHPKLFDISF